jgi:hypothetical protein
LPPREQIGAMRPRRRAWLIALAVGAVILTTVVATRAMWMRAIVHDLVCAPSVAPSDAIVVDNDDYNYLVFEHAAELQRSGVATRIFVPAQASSDPNRVNRVSRLIVEAMVEVSEVRDPAIVPVPQREPISLHVAYRVREALVREGIRSIVLVAAAFRSRRDELIYKRVLAPVGITVKCAPVFGSRTPDTWARSWHGIQEIGEQFLKLQYYRFYVLRFRVKDAGIFPNDE